MKLLVVEDEPKTGEYLRQGLTEAGFVVDLAVNGQDGGHLAMTEAYDLLILDVMLPGMDGWRILQTLRAAGNPVPVLFLTARDSVADRVKGLELGADDYLVKPFAFSELLARVRTLLRRGTAIVQLDRIEIGDLVLDLDAVQLHDGGAAPEQGPDPGQQLGKGKGFDEVVVGAQFQPLDPVGHAVAGGQEQHGHGVAGAAQGLEDAPAVHAGQHHVEDQQVVGLGHRQVPAVLTVDGQIHDEAGLGQALPQVFPGFRLVFHHQQLHAHSHPCEATVYVAPST